MFCCHRQQNIHCCMVDLCFRTVHLWPNYPSYHSDKDKKIVSSSIRLFIVIWICWWHRSEMIHQILILNLRISCKRHGLFTRLQHDIDRVVWKNYNVELNHFCTNPFICSDKDDTFAYNKISKVCQMRAAYFCLIKGSTMVLKFLCRLTQFPYILYEVITSQVTIQYTYLLYDTCCVMNRYTDNYTRCIWCLYIIILLSYDVFISSYCCHTIILSFHIDLFLYSWWRHDIEMLTALLTFVRGIHWLPVDSPHKGPVTVIFCTDLS